MSTRNNTSVLFAGGGTSTNHRISGAPSRLRLSCRLTSLQRKFLSSFSRVLKAVHTLCCFRQEMQARSLSERSAIQGLENAPPLGIACARQHHRPVAAGHHAFRAEGLKRNIEVGVFICSGVHSPGASLGDHAGDLAEHMRTTCQRPQVRAPRFHFAAANARLRQMIEPRRPAADDDPQSGIASGTWRSRISRS